MEKFNQFLAQFTEHRFDESMIDRIGKNYYYASKELQELRNSIKLDAFSLGIYLGEEKEGFLPSPALIDLISKMPGSEQKKVYINKKAEWLFLCARNILEPSIVKNPHNIKEGLVFVQNEQDENLGYGIFRREGKQLVIRNILDKGKYLRYNEKGRKR